MVSPVKIDHQNLQLINSRFTTIFIHFFCKLHKIFFHKTEIQMVILRCLMSLNQVMTQNEKNKIDKTSEFMKKNLQVFSSIFVNIPMKN
jgi:hypothetical protein